MKEQNLTFNNTKRFAEASFILSIAALISASLIIVSPILMSFLYLDSLVIGFIFAVIALVSIIKSSIIRKDKRVVIFVLGVVATFASNITWSYGVIFDVFNFIIYALVSLIFGIVSLRKKENGKVMVVASLILSIMLIIGIVLLIVLLEIMMYEYSANE
ncbi:MAG: hypothetical protein IKL73_04355 [Lachnospiraceae bacterium]|nr:hypothetical protein [Lachnospiraceae bacterium]